MPATTDKPLLKLQNELWKSRAQVKQQWLQRALAQPAQTPREQQRRTTWIKRALEVVKRSQDEIQYQTALIDAYAEHLSVLEMSLLQAAEGKKGAPV